MFASVSGGFQDFSSLDAKLEALGQDIEIYDFNDDPGLALDDSLNDLNEDTFGGTGPIGRDFDFSGTSKNVLPKAQSQPYEGSAPQNPATSVLPALQPWGASVFDADPLLSRKQAAPIPPFPNMQQAAAVLPGQNRYKTLAEIEADMFASRSSPRPTQPMVPQQQQQQQPARAYKTLEEIEAEMMRNRGSPQTMSQVAPSQNASSFAFPGQMPPPAPQLQPQMQQHHFVQSQYQRHAPHPSEPNMRFMPQQQQHQARPPSISAAQVPPQPAPPIKQQPQQVSQEVFQQLLRNGGDSALFPPLGTSGPVVPPPPPSEFQRGHVSSSQSGHMSLGQLHALRINLLSRPSAENSEALIQVESMLKEAEQQEALRRRKAGKIAQMSNFNGIMSSNEKDFITRIQLSQLLNTLGPGGEHDPMKEDFYFTVYQAIRGARTVQQQQAALAAGGKKRQQAMIRMAQQVQRIVDDARKKPRASQWLVSLDGALGKIALRTRAAPRQLLQVDRGANDKSDNSIPPDTGLASLPQNTSSASQKPALSKWKTLVVIEKLYSLLLELEHARRMQPELSARVANQAPDAEESAQELERQKVRYEELLALIWTELRVTEPLDISNPHPVISILTPSKGKKLIPRIFRHVSEQQILLFFTLLIATFSSLDVVRSAALLDSSYVLNKASTHLLETVKALETETDLFLGVIIPIFINTLGKLPLRIVAGMLGLFCDRNDIVRVAQSKPGLAFLTIFLSRAEVLKQSAEAAQSGSEVPVPDAQELQQWTQVYNILFNRLQGHLPSIFPSTRAVASLPFGAAPYLLSSGEGLRADIDIQDQPVWSFLAALAVSADLEQQQVLVTDVREKVLESVTSAARKNASEESKKLKIQNANLLLHALGLDASQITVD